MKRKALMMKLLPGQAAEYERRHNPIWPELSEALSEYGARNYSIFLDTDTNSLFAYLEVEDEERFAEIAKTDICRKWWAYMEPLMEYHADGTPWTRDLREVFHLA